MAKVGWQRQSADQEKTTGTIARATVAIGGFVEHARLLQDQVATGRVQVGVQGG
jgi:hypothetical protein